MVGVIVARTVWVSESDFGSMVFLLPFMLRFMLKRLIKDLCITTDLCALVFCWWDGSCESLLHLSIMLFRILTKEDLKYKESLANYFENKIVSKGDLWSRLFVIDLNWLVLVLALCEQMMGSGAQVRGGSQLGGVRGQRGVAGGVSPPVAEALDQRISKPLLF